MSYYPKEFRNSNVSAISRKYMSVFREFKIANANSLIQAHVARSVDLLLDRQMSGSDGSS